jgi:O-antigen ligase
MSGREHSRSRAPAAAPVCWAAALAVAALAAGGSTARPVQAAMLAGLGILWLFAPARHWPVRGFVICAGGLIALAATAWLPAAWLAAESWRPIVQSAGIPVPATHSPQPWLSAEAFLWLVAGLAWMAWLLGREWSAGARSPAMRILAGGVVLVATVALLAQWLHLEVPGWHPQHGFGPFPNRNHTGHVFALGGVLALGCAADAARRDWKKALPWLGGAGLIVVALIFAYSRGGLLLFFGAIAIWAAFASWQRRSWQVFAVGVSLVLVLGAVVLVAGGAFAGRFAGGADSQVAFRTLIWRDTLALIHGSPWCGAGLGNFPALFPFYRRLSLIQQSVLHPESDWLWLASEMGWLAVAFAAGAVFFVLRDAFPLAPGSRSRLRGAALAAALAAVVHCAIDVPVHHVGAALIALLVMALARNEIPASDSTGAASVWRALGLAALGGAVIIARIPDDAGDAQSRLQAGRFPEAAAAADRALARAPLDWHAYFVRAGARACLGRNLDALADFRRARTLEPHYAGLPFEEGRFWLQRQPSLALAVWSEALRRVHSPEDEPLYGAMLSDAPDNPDFRARLLALAQNRPVLQLQWFAFVPPAEARLHVEEMAEAAKQVSPAQRDAFRRRWHEIDGTQK